MNVVCSESEVSCGKNVSAGIQVPCGHRTLNFAMTLINVLPQTVVPVPQWVKGWLA